MPVIKVDNLQYPLHPGQNRIGSGGDADLRIDGAAGVQAVIEVAGDTQAVIRRAGDGADVRVNGIVLIDPTPLMHGDKVEIGGRELLYADDAKSGSTAFVSAAEIAAIAQKRPGPARATTAHGGRLVSLVDGKEYIVPEQGITIGRDAGAGVVVAENDVSRKHAEVGPAESGYELRDFSANGVYVNGVRIDKVQLLARSDVIRIGTEEFRFYADVRPMVAAPSLSNTMTGMPAAAPPAIAAPSLADTMAWLPAVTRQPPGDLPSVPGVGAANGRPTTASPVTAGPESRPVLASLEVTNTGLSKGDTYDIRVTLAHVGRGSHNDIVLIDDSVSDTHAKFQRRDDGWYLMDAGSTNGTYVGGQRLSGERRLEGAADVRFGGVKLVFRARDVRAEPVVGGTRAFASVDRSMLRPPQAVAASVRESGEPRLDEREGGGTPVWLWIVGGLAVAAAVGFFLLIR